jgi:hypothetical protein
MEISSIPKKSLRNLLIYAGVLAIVVGMLVVPSYLAIDKAKANRVEIESQVKEQRLLAPVFGKLVKKRIELNKSIDNLPVRAALARDEAGGVADTLTRLAVGNRMQVAGINLDLNAMVNDIRLMQVDMVLRGDLADYRTFLQQLIEVPYLEFIESLRILAIPNGREYRMRVWVALK